MDRPPVSTPPASPRVQADRAWDLRGTDPKAARDAALLALAASDEDPAAHARALAALGYAHFRLGEAALADDALAEAGAGAIRTGDAIARARTLVAIGVLRRGQGRYADAVTALRDAGDLYRQLDDDGGVAGVAINLGLVYKNLGDSAQALELLLGAERGFRATGDLYGEAVALNNVVAVYRDLGDSVAALPLTLRLCELSSQLGSPVFEVNAQVAHAAALAATGDLDGGLAAAERALALARPGAVPQLLADALGTLGLLLAPTDPLRAQALLEEAAGVHGATADAWAVVHAHICLAELHQQRNNPLVARALAVAAGDLAGHRGECALADRAWRVAALASEAIGDLPDAVAFWRRANAARDEAEADRRSRSVVLLEVNAAVALAREETERYRRRVTELAAAARFRTDLLGMVAHDLRSPLTAAMMSVDMLTERATTRTDAQLTDDLGIALHRMARIIDALSDDTAAEHGEFAPNLADEDLLGLVYAIVDDHAPAARGKGVRLTVDGTPARVRCDAGRLAHAIDNLVSNAVKYSVRGGSVRLRVLERPGVVRFEVEDEGPGVSQDDFARLFRPFARGSASPTAGERSTGLGLYIARRMVDLHSGRIGVEPGECGARFWFEIPTS